MSIQQSRQPEGVQTPAMLELINRPSLRTVPLTPADFNVIGQVMIGTTMGALVTQIIRAFFTGAAPGQPFPQVMIGRGTSYNAQANRMILDDLDPRVDTNMVHETIHFLGNLQFPILPTLPVWQYIVLHIYDEAVAQINAIEYALESWGLGLPQFHEQGLVYPALTDVYTEAYREQFLQDLLRLGQAANQQQAQAVYLTLNPNNPQHAMLLQLIHPRAQRVARQRVFMRGVLGGLVVTANTGHTYDVYYAMLWDRANQQQNGCWCPVCTGVEGITRFTSTKP